MKSYSSLFRTVKILCAAIFASSAVLSGCTTDRDTTLGFEFIPENQRMEMRHKKFEGGKVIKYDSETKKYITVDGRNIFETTLYRTDSIVSSNLQTGYIGIQNDPDGIFGKRTAGFASEFLFMSEIEKEGFGYMPIFDSMQLLISVSAFAGDTTYVQHYEVYEVLTALEDTMSEDTDDGETGGGSSSDETKVAYINHDMSKLYDPSKLLFTFDFPDQANGIYTTSTAVTMKPADLSAAGATWDFVKRLMLVDDNSADWDGYADDTEVYKDDEKWIEKFKGLYIKPVENLPNDKEGAVYATDLSSSGLYLLGRNRNPDEPMLIKDTVSMQYHFYDQYATKVGNTSINSVEHDFSGLSVLASASMTDDKDKTQEENRQSHTRSATGYIAGMGGPVTEIHFTDDFLNELHEISIEDEFRYASINQARLYVYLEKADYDWTLLDPSVMTPLLDASVKRLGLYTDYGSLIPIADYNYLYEVQYSTTLAYGGNINRSWCCYVMDISSYMQRLKNYIDWLVNNGKAENAGDGNYRFTFDSADEKYTARTLYLAPEAYDLYTFDRSKVQGMEDAANAASMKIELTYTMIK